ncbi:hypothetical protein HUN58_16985 [Curtobacterium sp. Csp1]|uniref:hypothetical protein n=1 Tax=Curtobacterium sp. Csp1 TaxID=2495429 RepID=UPI00159A1446|nr:hypothetical protein [Curtobacterium sp. Csp1]QKS21406.1 hypothetical protein HUN58_16985 [Curtobacterium sp. Csp1]
MDVDSTARALLERAVTLGQAVIRTDDSTPLRALRAAVRAAARASGASVRTGMVAEVLVVARTDAPLWSSSASEMRRALAAPDEPNVVR